MNAGRKNSKPNIGIHGHTGGTRPGQTRKTPKNLSAHESEDRGREESVGLYAACIYMDRGEDADSEAPSLLSYTLRYVSLQTNWVLQHIRLFLFC